MSRSGAASGAVAAFANPWLVLTLAPLLWAGNSVAGKLATADWPPFTLSLARWTLAGLLLLPFAWRGLRADWPVVRAHLGLLCAMGTIGMGLFSLLLYLALNTTTATNASIVQAVTPALIMVANFAVFRLRVSALQLAGLAASILGVIVVTTGGDPARAFAGGIVAGDAWMLLASAFYGGYTFALRWRPPIRWTSFMVVICASAAAAAAPFAAWELGRVAVPTPTAAGWAVLGYIVVFPTLVSQIAWARGVELIGSNRAGLFFNLMPIFGVALAVALLGERLAAHHAIGLVLVLGGIALAERVAARR